MIEKLRMDHINKIDENFVLQGWPSRNEILKQYLIEQEKGERLVLVDSENDETRGYITLVYRPDSGAFKDTGIPEIVDFNVFERFQKQGIGQGLLDAVIFEAGKTGSYVGIGVGLNSNYGKAQRLYVKNGFIPTGDGVYYCGKPLGVNEKCFNDDELALYFSKKIN